MLIWSLLQGRIVASLLQKLPTILILAVLVGIFISLRKHSPSQRTRLWIFAWTLIFVHFFVQIFETRTGFIEAIFESIDLAALELSGVVFLISLARAAEDRLRRNALFLILIPAATLHALGATFGWQNRWLMASFLAFFFFGLTGFAFFAYRQRSRFNTYLGIVFSAAGVWSVIEQLRGNTSFGVIAILTLMFLTCGFLFWRRFPQRSTGVVTVSAGFLCWGAVFPLGVLVGYLLPKLQINPEIWNVPKFFVAFGMILAVLEEKSRMVEESGAREHEENALMARFSRITSRLLSGAELRAMCQQIAEALTEAASFRAAAVVVASQDATLSIAGASSRTQEDARLFESITKSLVNERIGELCAAGQKLGSNSFGLKPDAANATINSGASEIIIPLVSSRACCLGWMVLFPAGRGQETILRELPRIEMLAADLSITIENSRLHHQLVRSEKLAALGQLVAGVAHELNNPLTGIIGYSDLLSEEISQESAAKKVNKLGNEARRMHRIVSGLLRFARQSNSTERAANFESALRDALQLREYHVRKFGIAIEMHIEPGLPLLAIGEDELKQIVLNLLNNAIDAVEESRERRIRIEAEKRSERVFFSFVDSGPGFSDLNRAFDPFYTTKAVGKGTGLGLSICYGIVRECGGEIQISNNIPYGATVRIEIPPANAHQMIPAS